MGPVPRTHRSWAAHEFPRPPLLIEVSRPGPGTAHVRLAGELDLATSGGLSRELRFAISAFARVVLDLGAVAFIDSTGLSAILGATAEARERGRLLELELPLPPQASRLIEIAGVGPRLRFTGAV